MKKSVFARGYYHFTLPGFGFVTAGIGDGRQDIED